MDVPEVTKIKAPGERLDYIFDWTDYMNKHSDVVQSVDGVVAEGVTIEPFSWDGMNQVLVWVSGGTRNTTGLVTCNVTSLGGRVASRSIQFLLRRR